MVYETDEKFPYNKDDCEGYQPVLINAIRNGLHYWYFLTRYLTETEEERLKSVTDLEELESLIDDIREINEPTIYEVEI